MEIRLMPNLSKGAKRAPPRRCFGRPQKGQHEIMSFGKLPLLDDAAGGAPDVIRRVGKGSGNARAEFMPPLVLSDDLDCGSPHKGIARR
ncbi:hypothetical protein [Bradyrhizobium sp. 134]|uniref:hypothetical protein n=1 Tax=Bradyrhizobium sp. 134 TaxID=2782611 RepID=UPI001FFC0803|nr:hypothetical protein [Bradyrhizobium sp. 134]